MKYCALLILLVLSGCVPPAAYQATHTDVILIGDSNCAWYESFPYEASYMLAGIKGDCVGGRSLAWLGSLPGARIIFLQLGVNDAAGLIPASEFGDHLTMLLGTTSAHVYCIYPTLPDGSIRPPVDDYVAEMDARCSDVIDPKEYGVTNGYGDGIHWSRQDHIRFYSAIIERMG